MKDALKPRKKIVVVINNVEGIIVPDYQMRPELDGALGEKPINPVAPCSVEKFVHSVR